MTNNKYLCLEFSNTCDVNGILYQKGFKQRMFIDSDIVRPVYEIKEEGYEDGEMNFIKTFEKERKIFKVEWLVYEYMLDAIYTIPLHDNKVLYLKNGESEQIDNLVIEQEWLTAGVAKLSLQFTTRYVIKTACCSNMGLIQCVTANHTAVKDKITTTNAIYHHPGASGVLVHDRYIITNATTGIDKIYIYTTLGWQEEVSVIGDVVYITALAGNYYYNGKNYLRYPNISAVTNPAANQIKVVGYSLPNTFVKIYYKKFSDIAYTLYPLTYTVEQLRNGITFSVLVDTVYNVKFYSYNHNCVYGYSNVETVVVT